MRLRTFRATVALLGGAAALACAASSRFSGPLPQGLPDVARWERFRGSYALETPRVTVEYELYVAPARPSVYSLTRYRATLEHAQEPSREKLQWDRNGLDVRRYECVPQTAAASMPCNWNEFLRGSPEYNQELDLLLQVYGMHARQSRGEGRR